MDSAEVKDFYNEYVPHQRSVGINIRHISIINRSKRAGLKASSSVLEIGCGIGTLTSLLAKTVTSGSIVAYDISDASIDVARKMLADRKNVQFIAADVVSYDDPRKYDIIIMADVLEHVPVEHHPSIFRKLSSMMKPDSVLAINIPFPPFNAWAMEHTPETMQIIDQALHTDALLTAAYPAGLHLHRLETYSLWRSPYDYQWMEFNKNERVQEFNKKSKLQVIGKMLSVRLGKR